MCFICSFCGISFTSKNTTFATVEYVFVYRCLFPYLQHAYANGLFNNGLHFEEEK